MKRILLTVASLSLLAGAAVADSHEPEKLRFSPVETFTCKYNDGMGRADLDKVNKAWNKWMDDENQDDYFAALITPNYFGEPTFDIGWLGVWRNGNAMGEGDDRWLAKGGKINAQYGEVLTCESHSNFASQNIRAAKPDDDESDMNFVLSFSNCTIKEGKNFEEFMAAQKEWNAYADEHGIMEANWVWWPVFGESNNDYDFKLLGGVDDHVMMGANWQLYSEGHFMKSSELFDELVDCDIARVYNGTTIREMADED